MFKQTLSWVTIDKNQSSPIFPRWIFKQVRMIFALVTSLRMISGVRVAGRTRYHGNMARDADRSSLLIQLAIVSRYWPAYRRDSCSHCKSGFKVGGFMNAARTNSTLDETGEWTCLSRRSAKEDTSSPPTNLPRWRWSRPGTFCQWIERNTSMAAAYNFHRCAEEDRDIARVDLRHFGGTRFT